MDIRRGICLVIGLLLFNVTLCQKLLEGDYILITHTGLSDRALVPLLVTPSNDVEVLSDSFTDEKVLSTIVKFDHHIVVDSVKFKSMSNWLLTKYDSVQKEESCGEIILIHISIGGVLRELQYLTRESARRFLKEFRVYCIEVCKNDRLELILGEYLYTI